MKTIITEEMRYRERVVQYAIKSNNAVALSQRGRQTMNRARVPFVFHHQKTREA